MIDPAPSATSRRRWLSLLATFILGAGLTLALLYGVRYARRPKIDPSQPIIPGKSLGPIAIGMSEEQVITALGKPDSIHGRNWQYTYPFMAVMFRKNEPRVGVILGGLVGVTDDRISGFPYRTREGIGMLSTGTQIRNAYGLPYRDEIQPTPNSKIQIRNITYPELGLQFMLTDGKVTWLCVRPAVSLHTFTTAPSTQPTEALPPDPDPAPEP